jgi:hypothetical protein
MVVRKTGRITPLSIPKIETAAVAILASLV